MTNDAENIKTSSGRRVETSKLSAFNHVLTSSVAILYLYFFNMMPLPPNIKLHSTHFGGNFHLSFLESTL